MDPINPGMPGGGMPPPPPPMGGQGNDPHDKIIEALIRIEDKLAQIAAKAGA